MRQIASGKFLLIGNGQNKKSMAYVGNITAFLQHCLSFDKPAYRVFNYIDKPDLNMNELVSLVKEKIDKTKSTYRIPYFIGIIGGYCFDLLSWISGKKSRISSVRVRKFCATTQFDSRRVLESEFKAPFTLKEGLGRTLDFEFISKQQDSITFETE